MRWDRARRSRNVEDRRGASSSGKSKLGAGVLLLVIVLSVLFDKHPLEVLGVLQPERAETGQTQPDSAAADADPRVDFVRAILGDTEDVWSALFAKASGRYEAPRLVLFDGHVDSACGGATAATGPFYCPADRQVYLDLSFFDELRNKLGGGGDFAQAYVIAHEVGHHVQTLLGIADEIQTARQNKPAALRGASGLLVRQELQADCFAGVWAYHAQQRHQWLDAQDVETALNTAAAIGDDRLQTQSRGYVMPESFTHGSSAQRVHWFQIGFKRGEIENCDTFSADPL